MVNLLPLGEDELVTNVLALPENEEEWADLNILFATKNGMARRNSMDAFTNIPSNGKYAMGFVEDSGDQLIGVTLLNEDQEVFLASSEGKAVRFAATDARETKSRTGIGVLGMGPKGGVEVVSLAILNTTGTTADERETYLKAADWKNNDNEPELPAERMTEMAEKEEFILTICANGYGKLSSAYEYRTIGRGGKGVVNIGSPDSDPERNGPVVASFPVCHGDQLMLVTDQAKLIRMKVEFRHLIEDGFEKNLGFSVIGRSSAGLKLFDVSDGEKVVGAAKIDEEEEPENEAEETVVDELADQGETDGGGPTAPPSEENEPD